jgi:hypothetical protein
LRGEHPVAVDNRSSDDHLPMGLHSAVACHKPP